jgi:hypothetical protein
MVKKPTESVGRSSLEPPKEFYHKAEYSGSSRQKRIGCARTATRKKTPILQIFIDINENDSESTLAILLAFLSRVAVDLNNENLRRKLFALSLSILPKGFSDGYLSEKLFQRILHLFHFAYLCSLCDQL